MFIGCQREGYRGVFIGCQGEGYRGVFSTNIVREYINDNISPLYDRYNTKHFNDEATPKSVKDMLS